MKNVLQFFLDDKSIYIKDYKLAFYNGVYIKAPLYQQAFRWFREKYNLHIPIRKVVGNRGTESEITSWTIKGTPWKNLSSYEEAELESLRELIKIVKDEKA